MPSGSQFARHAVERGIAALGGAPVELVARLVVAASALVAQQIDRRILDRVEGLVAQTRQISSSSASVSSARIAHCASLRVRLVPPSAAPAMKESTNGSNDADLETLGDDGEEFAVFIGGEVVGGDAFGFDVEHPGAFENATLLVERQFAADIGLNGERLAWAGGVVGTASSARRAPSPGQETGSDGGRS